MKYLAVMSRHARSTVSALSRVSTPKSRSLYVRALSTTQTPFAPANLESLKRLVTPSLQASDFQLLQNPDKSGDAEDALFEDQVQEVQRWWASKRFEGIKRPYSAQDIASKRGTLPQTYPSSLMARKLFNLLNDRAEKGLPVHTSRSSPSCLPK